MARRRESSPPPAPGAGRRRSDPASAGEPEDAVWRRERRGRTRAFGPVYRSGYLDAFLAGRLDDGADFAVAAGTHARHYPFFHPRSKWDDLLIVAGGERLLLSGRNVSGLDLALGPGGRASLGFHGRAFRPSGAAVELDLHLDLEAVLYPPRTAGRTLPGAWPRLQWQPALICGGGSITLHHARRRIERLAGLMERGSLTNLRGRIFNLDIDYLAVARPAAEPAAYVRLHVRPLLGGVAALPLRLLLGRAGLAEELTLEHSRPTPGDPHALAPAGDEPVEVLLQNRLRLGDVLLTRELLRIGTGEGERFGLRQRFDRSED